MTRNEGSALFLMWAYWDHPHTRTPGCPLISSEGQPFPPRSKHVSYATIISLCPSLFSRVPSLYQPPIATINVSWLSARPRISPRCFSLLHTLCLFGVQFSISLTSNLYLRFAGTLTANITSWQLSFEYKLSNELVPVVSRNWNIPHLHPWLCHCSIF